MVSPPAAVLHPHQRHSRWGRASLPSRCFGLGADGATTSEESSGLRGSGRSAPPGARVGLLQRARRPRGRRRASWRRCCRGRCPGRATLRARLDLDVRPRVGLDRRDALTAVTRHRARALARTAPRPTRRRLPAEADDARARVRGAGARANLEPAPRPGGRRTPAGGRARRRPGTRGATAGVVRRTRRRVRRTRPREGPRGRGVAPLLRRVHRVPMFCRSIGHRHDRAAVRALRRPRVRDRRRRAGRGGGYTEGTDVRGPSAAPVRGDPPPVMEGGRRPAGEVARRAGRWRSAAPPRSLRRTAGPPTPQAEPASASSSAILAQQSARGIFSAAPDGRARSRGARNRASERRRPEVGDQTKCPPGIMSRPTPVANRGSCPRIKKREFVKR